MRSTNDLTHKMRLILVPSKDIDDGRRKPLPESAVDVEVLVCDVESIDKMSFNEAAESLFKKWVDLNKSEGDLT